MSIATQDIQLDPAPAIGANRHWTGAALDGRWLTEARALVPVLAARADQVDERGAFVHESFDDLRDRRLLSMLVPSDLGGGGASHVEAGAVLAELARGCASTSLALSMHTHLVAAQVWRQHRGLPAPVLAKVVDAQPVLVSTGAADWVGSSGSAVKVDGGFRISGRKAPSSAAPAGAILVTSVRWDDGPDGPQVIHAAVPFAAEGVRIEPTWDTVGMRGTGSDTVVFEDVFVPDAAIPLIRPADVWHPVWNTVIGAAMPLIMATYVGIADAAVERALELARPRAERTDVAPLVGRMINRLTTAHDAVAAMLAASDDLHFDNVDEHAAAILARKAVAAEAAIDTVRLALEVGGGAAYATAGGMGRLLRDVHGALYHPLPAAQQERLTGRVALGLTPIGA